MVNPHSSASPQPQIEIWSMKSRALRTRGRSTRVGTASIFDPWVAITAEPWYGPMKLAFTESLDAKLRDGRRLDASPRSKRFVSERAFRKDSTDKLHAAHARVAAEIAVLVDREDRK